MTINEAWEKVNEDKFADMYFNLYGRWMDEKEYEDIGDYLKVIQKHFPEAKNIKKVSMRFTIPCSDGNLVVSVKRKGRYATIHGEKAA